MFSLSALVLGGRSGENIPALGTNAFPCTRFRNGVTKFVSDPRIMLSGEYSVTLRVSGSNGALPDATSTSLEVVDDELVSSGT